MGNGYWNKVLRIDLTERTTWVENVGEEVCKEVTGSAGYGAKVLLEEATSTCVAGGRAAPTGGSLCA